MGKQRGNADLADTAFFAKRSEQQRAANIKTDVAGHRSPRPQRRCDYCGKLGHDEDRCWTKEKDLKRAAAKANLAGRSSQDWPEDYTFASFSFLSSHRERRTSDWYVDSGASQHMSGQQWMFEDCKPVKPGSWTVIGIGSANLHRHGISSVPIRTKVNGT